MKGRYSQAAPFLVVAMAIGVMLSIGGCDSEKTSTTSQSRETKTSEKNIILARVQGEPVTAFDVEQAALKMLGAQQANLLDKKGRKKVLKSLVLSKALAKAAKSGLDAEELNILEWKVLAYKEQLLVNRYLRRHADPQPVTETMIKEHYENNMENYGGYAIREYELIYSRERMDGIQRERVLAKLADADTENDWSRYASKLSKENYSLEFRRGKTNANVTLEGLKSVLDNLNVSESSNPFFIEGKVYIARVISESKISPRPLSEVSADIRKALAPVQLKKAIKKISDKVLSEVNVEYTK